MQIAQCVTHPSLQLVIFVTAKFTMLNDTNCATASTEWVIAHYYLKKVLGACPHAESAVKIYKVLLTLPRDTNLINIL